eukprot:scaffold3051_cov167-Ochromonas_danica.AAC.39
MEIDRLSASHETGPVYGSHGYEDKKSRMNKIAFDVPAPPPPSRAESADVTDFSESCTVLSEKDIHDIFCYGEDDSALFFPPDSPNISEREMMEKHSGHTEGDNVKVLFMVNNAQQTSRCVEVEGPRATSLSKKVEDVSKVDLTTTGSSDY